MPIPSNFLYLYLFPILIQGTEKQVTEHVLNDLNRHLEMVTVFASQMDLKNLQITNKLQVRCKTLFTSLADCVNSLSPSIVC